MTLGITGIALIATLVSGGLLGLIAIPSVLFVIGCILLLCRPDELSDDDEDQIKKLFNDLQDPNQTEYNLGSRCVALGIDYRKLGLYNAADSFKNPISRERIKREAEQNLGKAAVKYGYAKLCEHIPEIKLLRANLALEILDRSKPLQPIIDKHTRDGLKALDLSSVVTQRCEKEPKLLDEYQSPAGNSVGKMTEAEFKELDAQIPKLKDQLIDRLREQIQDPNADLGSIVNIVNKHTMQGLNKLNLLPMFFERIKKQPEYLDRLISGNGLEEQFLGRHKDATLKELDRQIPGLKELLIARLKEQILDPNTDIGSIVKNHTLDGLINLGLKQELIARYKIEAPKMHFGEIIDQVGMKFIRKNLILAPEQRLQKWEQWKNNPVIRDEYLSKIPPMPSIEELLDNGFITTQEAQKWTEFVTEAAAKDPRKDASNLWGTYFERQEKFYESIGLKMDPLVRIKFRNKISGMTFSEFMNEYMPETTKKWSNTKLYQLLLSRPNHMCSPAITNDDLNLLSDWYHKLTKTPTDKKMVVAAEIDKEFQEQFVNVFDQPSAPELQIPTGLVTEID